MKYCCFLCGLPKRLDEMTKLTPTEAMIIRRIHSIIFISPVITSQTEMFVCNNRNTCRKPPEDESMVWGRGN